jgi:hypothetical protein
MSTRKNETRYGIATLNRKPQGMADSTFAPQDLRALSLTDRKEYNYPGAGREML